MTEYDRRFKCDFCGKTVKSAQVMERHEAHCNQNPEGLSCYMCSRATEEQFAFNVFCTVYGEPVANMGNYADECTNFRKGTRRILDMDAALYCKKYSEKIRSADVKTSVQACVDLLNDLCGEVNYTITHRRITNDDGKLSIIREVNRKYLEIAKYMAVEGIILKKDGFYKVLEDQHTFLRGKLLHEGEST